MQFGNAVIEVPRPPHREVQGQEGLSGEGGAKTYKLEEKNYVCVCVCSNLCITHTCDRVQICDVLKRPLPQLLV